MPKWSARGQWGNPPVVHVMHNDFEDESAFPTGQRRAGIARRLEVGRKLSSLRTNERRR
jgi:hypothetical protein